MFALFLLAWTLFLFSHFSSSFSFEYLVSWPEELWPSTQENYVLKNSDNLHSEGGQSVSFADLRESEQNQCPSPVPGISEDTPLPTVVDRRTERGAMLIKEDWLLFEAWRGKDRGIKSSTHVKIKNWQHVFSLSTKDTHRVDKQLFVLVTRTINFRLSTHRGQYNKAFLPYKITVEFIL